MAHSMGNLLRRKKRSRQNKDPPFPVPIGSITGTIPTHHAWFYYKGYLQGDGVVVQHSGDISYLYKMGFFGRGLFSRGAPEMHARLPTVHVPKPSGGTDIVKVLKRRRYLTHCHWKKSHDQLSTNQKRDPDDVEYDSEAELMDCPAYHNQQTTCQQGERVVGGERDELTQPYSKIEPGLHYGSGNDTGWEPPVAGQDLRAMEVEALQDLHYEDVSVPGDRNREDNWGNIKTKANWDTNQTEDDWDKMEADEDFWDTPGDGNSGERDRNSDDRQNSEMGNLNKDVGTASADSKVVETTSADTKVVETTSADTKVVETTSADTKVVETASADTKVVETTSADIKVCNFGDGGEHGKLTAAEIIRLHEHTAKKRKEDSEGSGQQLSEEDCGEVNMSLYDNLVDQSGFCHSKGKSSVVKNSPFKTNTCNSNSFKSQYKTYNGQTTDICEYNKPDITSQSVGHRCLASLLNELYVIEENKTKDKLVDVRWRLGRFLSEAQSLQYSAVKDVERQKALAECESVSLFETSEKDNCHSQDTKCDTIRNTCDTELLQKIGFHVSLLADVREIIGQHLLDSCHKLMKEVDEWKSMFVEGEKELSEMKKEVSDANEDDANGVGVGSTTEKLTYENLHCPLLYLRQQTNSDSGLRIWKGRGVRFTVSDFIFSDTNLNQQKLQECFLESFDKMFKSSTNLSNSGDCFLDVKHNFVSNNILKEAEVSCLPCSMLSNQNYNHDSSCHESEDSEVKASGTQCMHKHMLKEAICMKRKLTDELPDVDNHIEEVKKLKGAELVVNSEVNLSAGISAEGGDRTDDSDKPKESTKQNLQISSTGIEVNNSELHQLSAEIRDAADKGIYDSENLRPSLTTVECVKPNISDKPLHPYTEQEDLDGEYLVIEDSDPDGDAGQWTSISSHQWQPVRKKDPFPMKEPLMLSQEEAYFLAYGLGCLTVLDNQQAALSLTELWNLFLARPRFFPCYVAYHFIRSRGWVPRPGILFGTDFVVYKEGPPFLHSSFSVIVKAVHADDMVEICEYQNRGLTWTSLAGLDRLTEHVSKKLVICYVLIPRDLINSSKQTPDCISRCNIQLQLVNRWVSAQEREKEEDDDLL